MVLNLPCHASSRTPSAPIWTGALLRRLRCSLVVGTFPLALDFFKFSKVSLKRYYSSNLDEFLEFLESESSLHPAEYIKSLHLVAAWGTSSLISTFQLDPVLSKLPALRVLQVNGVDLQHSLDVVVEWMPRRPLKELRRSSLKFISDQVRTASGSVANVLGCGVIELFNLFTYVPFIGLGFQPA